MRPTSTLLLLGRSKLAPPLFERSRHMAQQAACLQRGRKQPVRYRDEVTNSGRFVNDLIADVSSGFVSS